MKTCIYIRKGEPGFKRGFKAYINAKGEIRYDKNVSQARDYKDGSHKEYRKEGVKYDKQLDCDLINIPLVNAACNFFLLKRGLPTYAAKSYIETWWNDFGPMAH